MSWSTSTTLTVLTCDSFAELHPSGSRPDAGLRQDYVISPRREQEGTDDTRLDCALLAVEVRIDNERPAGSRHWPPGGWRADALGQRTV
jgi:hypothetical protein